MFEFFFILCSSAALFSVSSAFIMKRFLTGATTSIAANKKVCTEAPQIIAAPLVTPTILTYDDIAQARASKVGEWTSYAGILYKLHPLCPGSAEEMVAFDMDGTLIKTKSGKAFAINEDDWTIWDPSVRTTLQRLHNENKYLAIISNQSGLKDGKVTAAGLKRKVDAIIASIGVPMDFICAMEDDRFRKPRPGMYEFLCAARHGRSTADTVAADGICSSDHPAAMQRFAQSTYVGDAAGRPKEGTRNKDFADSDYKLALNIGAKFCTPEKFFLGAVSRLHCQLPHPSASAKAGQESPTLTRLIDAPKTKQVLPANFFTPPELRTATATDSGASSRTTGTTADAVEEDNRSDDGRSDVGAPEPIPPLSAGDGKPELLLLAAPPACGKSTLARRFERAGYVRVNQDTLGSVDKCLAAARQALEQGRSVCVDNTNMDVSTRAKWVHLAKQCGVQAHAVALKTSKEICNLLSTFRTLDPTTVPADRRKIDKIVINTYFKTPVYPTLREGFSRVDEVELDLQLPTDPVALRYFHMYLKG